jgi:hypothetical protein
VLSSPRKRFGCFVLTDEGVSYRSIFVNHTLGLVLSQALQNQV